MGTAIKLTAAVSTGRTAGRTTSRAAKSIARYLPVVGRVVMGLPFFITGLNGLLNFLPQPTVPMSAGATAFLGALVNSGYMLPLIATTQLIVGALLLSGRFVPLALALIAPFIVNSILFHVFLEPSGLPFASVFLIIELCLVRAYWKAFRPMLVARVPLRSE